MHNEAYDTFYKLDLTHWFPSGRRCILEGLIGTYAPHPARIADIGCGTGANWEMLANFAPVVGVDFFPQAVTYCRLRGLSCAAVAGLPQLPFRDAAFDLVCALDVVEHITDDAAAVGELLRICQPGGTVLITVPAYQWLWSRHDEANQHKRRYTRRQLVKLLSRFPADVIKISHFNLFLSPIIITVRLLQKARDKLRPPHRSNLDYEETPRPLNKILYAIFAAERFFLPHIDFPAGISIVCITRKRE